MTQVGAPYDLVTGGYYSGNGVFTGTGPLSLNDCVTNAIQNGYTGFAYRTNEFGSNGQNCVVFNGQLGDFVQDQGVVTAGKIQTVQCPTSPPCTSSSNDTQVTVLILIILVLLALMCIYMK